MRYRFNIEININSLSDLKDALSHFVQERKKDESIGSFKTQRYSVNYVQFDANKPKKEPDRIETNKNGERVFIYKSKM